MASNYDLIKTAMTDAGFPVTEGAQWQGPDFAAYRQFCAAQAYATGEVFNEQDALVGVAYPAVLPASVAAEAGITRPPFLPTPPDPNRVQRQFNQTLPAIAMNGPNMLVGTGIPASAFYTASNGDIHLAVSLRYRYDAAPVVVTGPNTQVIIKPRGDDGSAWAAAISITSLNNRFITDDYTISVYRRCLRGMPGMFQSLDVRQHGPSGYVLGSNGDMSTGKYQVAQEVIPSVADYPNDETALVGAYVLGIRAVKNDGQVVQVELTVITDTDPPPAVEPPDDEEPPTENTEE
ncbi:MAG: hypothetical protein ACN6OP_13435 [Pseudomonadales bacterium]